MTKLSIRTIGGVQCATSAEGLRLRDVLLPVLRRGENVELDFEGVELASSTFFNSSILPAIMEWGEKFYDKHVSHTNLKPRVEFVLNRTRSSYAKAS